MLRAHITKCCYALLCLFWITSICLWKSTHTQQESGPSQQIWYFLFMDEPALQGRLAYYHHSTAIWPGREALTWLIKTNWDIQQIGSGLKTHWRHPVSRTRIIRSNEKTLLSDGFQNVWRTYTDLTLTDIQSTVFGILPLYIMIYYSSVKHTTHQNNMPPEVCPGECLQKRGKREVVLSALHWNRCLFTHGSVPAWEVRLPVSQKGITLPHVSSSFLLLLYCS